MNFNFKSSCASIYQKPYSILNSDNKFISSSAVWSLSRIYRFQSLLSLINSVPLYWWFLITFFFFSKISVTSNNIQFFSKGILLLLCLHQIPNFFYLKETICHFWGKYALFPHFSGNNSSLSLIIVPFRSIWTGISMCLLFFWIFFIN